MTNKLELVWCRTFQAVLKIGNYFMGYRMPHYLEGPGKIQTAILVCISVAVIFAMVLLMSWLRQRQESQKMTEQLKKLQG